MARNTLTTRIAVAAGIPVAAAAAALLATAASAASSNPTPAAPHHASHPAAGKTVKSFATQAPRSGRSHEAEPGDAQGRANEPGEDVQGQAGEVENENETGDDNGGTTATQTQGADNSGPGNADSGNDNSGPGSTSSGPGSDGSGDQSGSGDGGSGHHGGSGDGGSGGGSGDGGHGGSGGGDGGGDD
jgi:hypothetical protein